jgi:Tfp pilus assembly protein PilP
MTHIKHIALALVAAATLAGCTDNFSDLEAKVTEIKARPGGRSETLPEVKPYETFT